MQKIPLKDTVFFWRHRTQTWDEWRQRTDGDKWRDMPSGKLVFGHVSCGIQHFLEYPESLGAHQPEWVMASPVQRTMKMLQAFHLWPKKWEISPYDLDAVYHGVEMEVDTMPPGYNPRNFMEYDCGF